jgi:hypothetical protein
MNGDTYDGFDLDGYPVDYLQMPLDSESPAVIAVKKDELVAGLHKALPHIKGILSFFEPVVACPLCGGVDHSKHDTGIEVEEIWTFSECDECGMVFQATYMQGEDIERYYKNIYRKCVWPFEAGVDEKKVFGETDSAIKYLVRSRCEPKRHLDIGSSTGSFLRTTNVAYDCEVVGVEPGDIYREYSIGRGIPTFGDISEVSGEFDFISMCHVLEHILKPMEMLAAVRELLDGQIYVEVPRKNYAISHFLVFEDDEMLVKMLETAGFKILNTEVSEKWVYANAVKG